jgi:hypothetical protein
MKLIDKVNFGQHNEVDLRPAGFWVHGRIGFEWWPGSVLTGKCGFSQRIGVLVIGSGTREKEINQ